MLARRLIRFLRYNTQQYISLRTEGHYDAAVARLQKMGKLVRLIEQADERLTSDEAMLVERAQLHLVALGILTEL